MIETDDHIIAMAFVLVKIYSEDKILDCSVLCLQRSTGHCKGEKTSPWCDCCRQLIVGQVRSFFTHLLRCRTSDFPEEGAERISLWANERSISVMKMVLIFHFTC